MQNLPLVSIIVPIYNVEKYIGECLDSLFRQTYQQIEFIFVNDKTPDKSMSILEQKIKEYKKCEQAVIINKKVNQGLAGARIDGLINAKGDYYAIVDSDDFITDDAIEKLVQCALQTNADIVESNFFMHSGKGSSEYHRSPFVDKESRLCELISLSSPVALWAKLYKRDLFNDVHSLFIVGNNEVEDYYATPQLYNKAAIISSIKDCTYYYRIDNNNAYSRSIKWSKIDCLLFAIKAHETLFCTSNCSKYNNAILQAKYYTIYSNFGGINPDDRNRLIHIFPEVDEYVAKLSFSKRLLWRLIRKNYLSIYKALFKIFKLFKI